MAAETTKFRDLPRRLLVAPEEDAVFEGPAGPPAETRADRLPKELRPGSHLLDADFPKVEFAIEPYLPRAELTELVGAHGIFKSTAALGACLSVATGRPWGGGAPVTKGRSAFVTMEDSERTLSWRVRAWLESVPSGSERADAEGDLRRNFGYLAREHAQELAMTATASGASVPRPEVVARISELVDGAILAVLETAARLHSGPEMNEALAVFAQAVEHVAVKSGAAVAIVRHTSKAAALEQRTDSYSGRGGGALSDAARSVLVMTRERPQGGEDADPLAPVRLSHPKGTHAKPGAPIVWRPVETTCGVYLEPLTRDEEVRGDAARLLTHLRQTGGASRTDLHKRTPEGLTRNRALAALEHLIQTGQIQPWETTKGRQLVTLYRAAE